MLEKLLGKDPDLVFAYQTERILKVKDWTLAIIGNIFTLAVLAYIIIYVFIILEKYNSKGVWTGYAFFNVEGKGYSYDNETYTVWDHGDLLYPEQDSQGLMIGIRVDEIPEQTYGYCQYTCFIDSDCEANPPVSYAKCNDNGYCESPSWCPSIDSNTTQYNSYTVEGIESFKLQIKSGITFPQFDTEEYISYSKTEEVYSSSKASIFYIKDILNEAGIDSVKDILETGAIIEMSFDWKCNAVKSSCTPDISFSRMDSESFPTYYSRVFHYRSSDQTKRNFKRFQSIRLMIRSYGQAYKFSLFLTVLQISAGLALLKMANLISDWIILYVYPVKSKREEFAKLKTEESVDFSDKAYKIDYINFMRKQDEEDEGRIGNN